MKKLSKIGQRLVECCQSGEISPNMVTLLVNRTFYSACFLYFQHASFCDVRDVATTTIHKNHSAETLIQILIKFVFTASFATYFDVSATTCSII